MTLKEFFKDNGFTGKPDIRKSESCYEGSDENIRYIRLPKDVDGFNFMVISENGYAKAREDKKNLAELDVVYDEEYGWHAQLPDSTEADDLDFDW